MAGIAWFLASFVWLLFDKPQATFIAGLFAMVGLERLLESKNRTHAAIGLVLWLIVLLTAFLRPTFLLGS